MSHLKPTTQDELEQVAEDLESLLTCILDIDSKAYILRVWEFTVDLRNLHATYREPTPDTILVDRTLLFGCYAGRIANCMFNDDVEGFKKTLEAQLESVQLLLEKFNYL